MSNHNEEVLAAAKEYIKRDYFVFPLHSVNEDLSCTCGSKTCTDQGKHPRTERGLKDASRDPEQIEKWFGVEAPLSNIGIVTGEISGITVIDIDIGEGKFGAESWAEAIEGHGEPDTLMAETGSRGLHCAFKYNSALKTASNVLGKGVDCRNDGGYIVAAPSKHKSGGSYKWLDLNKPLANLPAHLSHRKETRGRPRKSDTLRKKYTIEEVRQMLEFVPSDDRDIWRSMGIILGREFQCSDEAWTLYNEWADKEGGKKGRNHDEIMREAFYVLSHESSEKELTIATIVKLAKENGWAPLAGKVPIDHFVFNGSGNNFPYLPNMSYWVAAAVDAAVSPVNENGKIIKASEWLKKHRLITSITSEPKIEGYYLEDYDCRGGEISKVVGAALLNTFRPATIELGDANKTTPWLDHVNKIFNKDGDALQFIRYMAHRVQKPWEKPRFALMLAGGQGVGKDTAVEFCCPAIGHWNVANIDPSAFESSFNEFHSATLVRISEAANLHEMNKWAFNERTKVLIAGSPDYCTVNPKYGQKYSVRLHCGVILTTNHLASGIYIPPDDRRYDVIETATLSEMGLTNDIARRQYFAYLWDWFLSGGDKHVAAYLHELDISEFSASNGQRKTLAHQGVVQAGRERHAWLRDILEELDYPQFVSFPHIRAIAEKHGEDTKAGSFLTRSTTALEDSGYAKYRNSKATDGRWYKTGFKKGFNVYAREGVPLGQDPTPFVKASDEVF